MQTVPLLTEISQILGFSFIWVKCISSSSARRERQFDGGGKKSGYDMMSWCKRVKGKLFNCQNSIVVIEYQHKLGSLTTHHK